MPPYLDRPQIVTRTSRAKLTLAEFDQWAAPLSDTIPRVLAENLSLLVPTERVILHPWPRTIDPDYQVIVEVFQFDQNPGGPVVLTARWSLLDRDAQELALRTSRLSLWGWRSLDGDQPLWHDGLSYDWIRYDGRRRVSLLRWNLRSVPSADHRELLWLLVLQLRGLVHRWCCRWRRQHRVCHGRNLCDAPVWLRPIHCRRHDLLPL
jgi:hypothetical protein